MRFERTLILFVFCIAVAMAPPVTPSQTQSPPAGLQEERWQSDVAQALAAQDQVIILPAKGRVKRSLKRDAKLFVLPTGETPVLLFKLPDYSAPYSLTITSLCNRGCLGLSKSIFVPAGTFLDAEFRPVRELPAAHFESLEAGFTKPYRLEATVLIDEPR